MNANHDTSAGMNRVFILGDDGLPQLLYELSMIHRKPVPLDAHGFTIEPVRLHMIARPKRTRRQPAEVQMP